VEVWPCKTETCPLLVLRLVMSTLLQRAQKEARRRKAGKVKRRAKQKIVSLGDGHHRICDDAWLHVYPDQIKCTAGEYAAMKAIMSVVPSHMTRFKTLVRRKHATFLVTPKMAHELREGNCVGDAPDPAFQYKFGNHTSVPCDPEFMKHAPMADIFRLVERWSKLTALKTGVDERDGVHMVHVNYYDTQSAGIPPHADDEPCIQSGSTIFSFTLMEGAAAPPRLMRIARKDGTGLRYDVKLRHNSCVLMGGADFQRLLLHGVPGRPLYVDEEPASRINITVRSVRVGDK
jgi:alkylated DNA repair dioxygenase AlkB